MISRLRVEVRAASMEEAEREANILLDHARQAGFLEGIVPQSARVTDHHFGNALATRSAHDPPEPWSELGLHYEGRIVLMFDPEVVRGGLKEFGYKVVRHDEQGPPEGWPADNGEDVTEKVMVLERSNRVTREHSWEGSSNYYQEGPFTGTNYADGNLARRWDVEDYHVSVWLTNPDPEGRIGRVVSYVRQTTIGGAAPASAYEHEYEVEPDEDLEVVIEREFEKALIFACARAGVPVIPPSVAHTSRGNASQGATTFNVSLPRP